MLLIDSELMLAACEGAGPRAASVAELDRRSKLVFKGLSLISHPVRTESGLVTLAALTAHWRHWASREAQIRRQAGVS